MDTALLQLIADGETQVTGPRSRSDTELLRVIATALTGVTQTSRSNTELLELIATAKSGVLQQSLSDTELLEIYAQVNSGQVQKSLSDTELLRIISVVPMTNSQKLNYSYQLPVDAPAGIQVRVTDAFVVTGTPDVTGDGFYAYDVRSSEQLIWSKTGFSFISNAGQIEMRDSVRFNLIMQSDPDADPPPTAPWEVLSWFASGQLAPMDPQPVLTYPVVQQTVAVRTGTGSEEDWEIVPES